MQRPRETQGLVTGDRTGRWTGLSRRALTIGLIVYGRRVTEAETTGLFLSRGVVRRAGGLWQSAVIDVVGEVVGGRLGVYPERSRPPVTGRL
jgi:hypothetical protein